jgi:hypothetical protein
MAFGQTTAEAPAGKQIAFIVGIGPTFFNNFFVDYLTPFFSQVGLQLLSIDTSNWSMLFGGSVTITAITQKDFADNAAANTAAMSAMASAGFSVQSHLNVPLASILPGFVPNSSLAPQDQYSEAPAAITSWLVVGGIALLAVYLVARR